MDEPAAMTSTIPLNAGTVYAVVNAEKVIAAGSKDATVQLIKLPTKSSRILKGHTGAVRSLAVHDNILASGSQDGTVRMWDIRSGNSMGRIDAHLGSKVTSVAFSKNGEIIASGSENTIAHWCRHSGRLLSTFGHRGTVLSVVFSKYGTMYSASTDKTVRAWHTSSSDQHCALPALSGTSPAVVTTADFEIKHPDFVSAVSVSSDGLMIATGCLDGVTRLYSVGDKEYSILKELTGHKDGVLATKISPSGKYVASGGKDNVVRLWEIESGACILELTTHTDWVCSVTFGADGATLFSGSVDGNVCVYQLSNFDDDIDNDDFENDAHSEELDGEPSETPTAVDAEVEDEPCETPTAVDAEGTTATHQPPHILAMAPVEIDKLAGHMPASFYVAVRGANDGIRDVTAPLFDKLREATDSVAAQIADCVRRDTLAFGAILANPDNHESAVKSMEEYMRQGLYFPDMTHDSEPPKPTPECMGGLCKVLKAVTSGTTCFDDWKDRIDIVLQKLETASSLAAVAHPEGAAAAHVMASELGIKAASERVQADAYKQALELTARVEDTARTLKSVHSRLQDNEDDNRTSESDAKMERRIVSQLNSFSECVLALDMVSAGADAAHEKFTDQSARTRAEAAKQTQELRTQYIHLEVQACADIARLETAEEDLLRRNEEGMAQNYADWDALHAEKARLADVAAHATPTDTLDGTINMLLAFKSRIRVTEDAEAAALRRSQLNDDKAAHPVACDRAGVWKQRMEALASMYSIAAQMVGVVEQFIIEIHCLVNDAFSERTTQLRQDRQRIRRLYFEHYLRAAEYAADHAQNLRVLLAKNTQKLRKAQTRLIEANTLRVPELKKAAREKLDSVNAFQNCCLGRLETLTAIFDPLEEHPFHAVWREVHPDRSYIDYITGVCTDKAKQLNIIMPALLTSGGVNVESIFEHVTPVLPGQGFEWRRMIMEAASTPMATTSADAIERLTTRVEEEMQLEVTMAADGCGVATAHATAGTDASAAVDDSEE